MATELSDGHQLGLADVPQTRSVVPRSGDQLQVIRHPGDVEDGVKVTLVAFAEIGEAKMVKNFFDSEFLLTATSPRSPNSSRRCSAMQSEGEDLIINWPRSLPTIAYSSILICNRKYVIIIVELRKLRRKNWWIRIEITTNPRWVDSFPVVPRSHQQPA